MISGYHTVSDFRQWTAPGAIQWLENELRSAPAPAASIIKRAPSRDVGRSVTRRQEEIAVAGLSVELCRCFQCSLAQLAEYVQDEELAVRKAQRRKRQTPTTQRRRTWISSEVAPKRHPLVAKPTVDQSE